MLIIKINLQVILGGFIQLLNYFGKVVLDKQLNQMTIDPEARWRQDRDMEMIGLFQLLSFNVDTVFRCLNITVQEKKG